MQYIDKHGDLWVRVDDYYVRRLKDNNIGTWQDGYGLNPVKPDKENTKERWAGFGIHHPRHSPCV